MATKKRTKSIAPTHTTHIVRNQSERFSPVLAIAVHSTESNDIPHSRDDIVSVRNWFDNPASDASSHLGVDGDGNSEVWVRSNKKAWTILNANPWTLNIEFVARATQAGSSWEEEQIKEGARWAAYWGLKYEINAQRGNVKNVHGQCVCGKKGVITHKDVTDAGFGTHTDPGANFPMSDFIDAMRYYKQKGWTLK